MPTLIFESDSPTEAKDFGIALVKDFDPSGLTVQNRREEGGGLQEGGPRENLVEAMKGGAHKLKAMLSHADLGVLARGAVGEARRNRQRCGDVVN
eukprot:g45866.t1